MRKECDFLVNGRMNVDVEGLWFPGGWMDECGYR